jgi:tungstate transport system substrate-binding protein
MKKTIVLTMAVLAVLFVGAIIGGCASTPPSTVTPTPTVTTPPSTTAPITTAPTGPREDLLIATTTSLYDTGLLDHLETIYESQYNVDLKITSQGTGKAIELAKRGDADILLVHSPSQELAYLEDGFGLNRRSFAYNYFIIVGPANDPAGITGLSPEDAFKKIRTEGMKSGSSVFFVSRGDNSGTHSAEKTIWKNAGLDYATQIQKSGNWYIEAGRGMGETLTLANEKQAYTLSDEGTFLAFKSDLSLTPLVSQGSSLLNVYSVMTVYPQNPDPRKIELANQFVNYLISNQTMNDIGNFGVDKYGKGLFTPMTKGVPPGVTADFTTPAIATKPLKIYHAGSLNAPMAKLEKVFEQQHPDVDVQLFSGGSGTLVDKVNKNGQFADVLASTDYTLIPKYLMPKNASYYLNFAKNSIVLCYNNMSQFANEITADNWYLILNRQGVNYAISDPTSDPAGSRSLMTIQLAERHYGLSNIFENLIGGHSKITTTSDGSVDTINTTNPSPDGIKLTITKTGPDIVPLLTGGKVDYAFEYSSVAIQNGLSYATLPEAIDLSSPADADTYALVQVKRLSGTTTVTEVGTPIIYGVTVPSSARDPANAMAFVNLLISHDGQSILSADGQTPIIPAMGYGSVPAGIQTGA